MTQKFQMSASFENLPNPGNSEEWLLSLCPTAVLHPLLHWLCEWCLSSPKWPDCAVPLCLLSLQPQWGQPLLENFSSLPPNKDKGSFSPQRAKEGVLQVARNLIIELQSQGSDRNRTFTAGIRKKILLGEFVGIWSKCILVTDAFCLPEQTMLAIQMKAGHNVSSILSSKLMAPSENLLQHLCMGGVGLDSTPDSEYSSIWPYTGEKSFPWAWVE